MNDPNTNWSVSKKLKTHRDKNELPQMVIGSLGSMAYMGPSKPRLKKEEISSK